MKADNSIPECPVCQCGVPGPQAFVGGHVYLKCEGCGLLYLERMPSVSELESYYNTHFQVDRVMQEKKIDGQYRPILKLMDELLPDKGRLLEIGCSYGQFLSRAQADGWQVEGVEISRTAAEWAREELRLEVHTGTLDEVSSKLGAPYDAVAMFHVLEHTPEPGRLVQQARDSLRPGGIMVIRTPNASSWIAKRCGTYWEWLTPPAHIHLFSPSSLQRLLERTGFQVERISTRRGDAHNTVFELARAAGKKFLSGKGAPVKARGVPASRSRWYRLAEACVDAVYRPAELIEDIYLERRLLGPELLSVSRLP